MVFLNVVKTGSAVPWKVRQTFKVCVSYSNSGRQTSIWESMCAGCELERSDSLRALDCAATSVDIITDLSE